MCANTYMNIPSLFSQLLSSMHNAFVADNANSFESIKQLFAETIDELCNLVETGRAFFKASSSFGVSAHLPLVCHQVTGLFLTPDTFRKGASSCQSTQMKLHLHEAKQEYNNMSQVQIVIFVQQPLNFGALKIHDGKDRGSSSSETDALQRGANDSALPTLYSCGWEMSGTNDICCHETAPSQEAMRCHQECFWRLSGHFSPRLTFTLPCWKQNCSFIEERRLT